MNSLSSSLIAAHHNNTAEPWWKGAVIYQIYPRSFYDSNGDGIGDLNGIAEKLPYVASLGVDAIWISPFYTSPMRDFGYDVANYCDVDPIFGTLEDFDRLVECAHQLGLKVIIDQVFAHTSDAHDWFQQSRLSRDNPHADWYVWADAKADGSPPSNWQSVFGGPSWTWDARRGQYYLHNFLSSQPQLNCHHPNVQRALLNVLKFWLDRGVDGFRMDAINFTMHDPEFRDNPPAPDNGKLRTRPFDFQLKVHNQSHENIPALIEKFRALTNSYGAIYTVAEVGGDDAAREMHLFTEGNKRFNSAYSFDFLYADNLTPDIVANAIKGWPDNVDTGWPSWAFENHDAPRAISRWTTPESKDVCAKMKMALLMAMRGNAFIYYGEELGLTQVEIDFADLQDPEAIANWPLTLSRDGARTPMPWDGDKPHMGFTDEDSKPWLPLGQDHGQLAITVQENKSDSLLNFTRNLIAIRKKHAPLKLGNIQIDYQDDEIIAFTREYDGQRISCLFNLSSEAANWPKNIAQNGDILLAVNDSQPGETLPPYGAILIIQ